MERIRHLKIVKNDQPPRLNANHPLSKSSNFNHSYDVVTYPEGTPMTEVTLSQKRQIVVAQAAMGFAPDYRRQGSCNGSDPNLFLPKRGESTLPAKKVCSGCEVRCHCLEEGLLNNAEGVWGGTSKGERKKISAARNELVGETSQP